MDPLTWSSFAIAFVIALTSPARRWAQGAVTALDRATRIPALAPICVFIAAMSIGLVPLLLGHAPIPSIHDEFGNLLIADTFVHGRLTNETPPCAEHFRTVHVMVLPTYTAKFPPGLGMFLAAGQVFGHPAIGAVMSVALACAFVTVALRYFVPPRWAFVGGLVAATHTLIYWWGQSYWGGGVAMLGGAILLAGAGRAMRRKPDARVGAVIGIGLFVFALSRPLEGLIVAMVLAWVVVARAIRSNRLRLLLTRLMPGMLVVLLPAFVWTGYYNWRVTGHWTRMPWVEYARQSMTTPIFWWQSLPPEPAFPDDKLRQFHAEAERTEYDAQRAMGYVGRIESIGRELLALWINQKDQQAQPQEVVPRPTALALLVIALACWNSRAARLGTFLFVALFLIHPAITPWMRAQYMAPAAAGFFLALTAGLRALSRWRPLGAALVIGFATAQFAALGTMIAQIATNDAPPGIARQRMVDLLASEPGNHLVLVRYAPGPQQVFEWVYNGADVKSSKVIFARSIDPDSDRALLEHFTDRQVWVLDVADRAVSPLRPVRTVTGP